LSEKDDFAIWFEESNFGGDMWNDFRSAHKQLVRQQSQITELEEENKKLKQDCLDFVELGTDQFVTEKITELKEMLDNSLNGWKELVKAGDKYNVCKFDGTLDSQYTTNYINGNEILNNDKIKKYLKERGDEAN
jgi:hypothetical protein